MDLSLDTIKVPWSAIDCSDIKRVSLYDEIVQFHDDLINLCLDSSKKAIPHKQTREEVIPGWNEYAQ